MTLYPVASYGKSIYWKRQKTDDALCELANFFNIKLDNLSETDKQINIKSQ